MQFGDVRGPGAPTEVPAESVSIGLYGSGYPDRSQGDSILDNMPKYNKYDPAAREPMHGVDGLDFGAEEQLNRGIAKRRAEEVQIQENNY